MYGNLVITLQGELLFCSVSYIFTHGKLLGSGESDRAKESTAMMF